MEHGNTMADAKLCENCRLILTGTTTHHHADYDSLMVSVRSGCVICRWLSLQVTHAPENSPQGQNSFRSFCNIGDLHYAEYYSEGKLGLVIFRTECSWTAPSDIQVFIYPHADGSSDHDDISEFSNRNYLPPPSACQLKGTKIGSDKSIGIIKTWLDSCNKDHAYCSGSSDRTFFPTRIIDVQNVENGTIVLRNRNEVVMSTLPDKEHHAASHRDYPDYWTLSHRWGDPELVVQLLQTNEQRFRRGIALEELSSTFRDAVTLVHKLGYRYIWIDSLCIIQDSDSMQDWKQEAPTMKDVYGNSYCNISAIRSSHDVSLGLFGQRFVEPCTFYPFSANLDMLKGRKNLAGKWNFWLHNLWINEMNRSPLSRRGWVVQEKFLARRIIHFTQSQIYWECLEYCRCEADPKDELGLLHLDSSSEVGRQAREYKAALRKIIMESVPIDSRRNHVWESSNGYWPTLRECWRIMVTTYSRCDLSKNSDRLIAISGVAKKFEEMYVHDRYLDGLWKEGLHTDLLWESNAYQGAPVMRSGTFAPSWSWASIHGGSVSVPTAHQKFGGEPSSCIEFVAARIIRPEAAGSNDSTALLQLESSELDIECVVCHFIRAAGSKTLEIFEDDAFSKPIPDMQSITQDKLRLDTEEMVQRFDRNGDIKGVCIPVQEANTGYGYRTVCYLLLEPVSVPRLRYKRIGTVVSGGFGVRWDRNKPTRITLV